MPYFGFLFETKQSLEIHKCRLNMNFKRVQGTGYYFIFNLQTIKLSAIQD